MAWIIDIHGLAMCTIRPVNPGYPIAKEGIYIDFTMHVNLHFEPNRHPIEKPGKLGILAVAKFHNFSSDFKLGQIPQSYYLHDY